MKKIINNSCLFVSLLLLGACSAEDASLLSSSRQEIEVAVSIDTPEQTKGGGDINGDGVVGNGGAFDTNDEFTLYLATRPDGATDKKADYQYVNDNWVATPPLYWDNQKGCPFSAISPKYTADGKYKITGNGAADTYSVKIDQSDATKQKTNDLLIARSTVTDRLLKVNFHHVFCRVVVQLTAATIGDGKFTATDFDNAVVTLNGICVDAKINYSTTDETVTAMAMATGTTTNDVITMKTGTPSVANDVLTASYSAIIPQQALTEGGKLVTITPVNKNTYTYSYKNTDLQTGIATPLAQGKETTINIKLTKKNVVGNISITGWGEGPTVTDNEAIVLPK